MQAGLPRRIAGKICRRGRSHRPARAGRTGNHRSRRTRDQARDAAFFGCKGQPATGSQIQLFSFPCLDDRCPDLHTAQDISPDAQGRKFIGRVDGNKLIRVHPQFDKAWAVKPARLALRPVSHHPKNGLTQHTWHQRAKGQHQRKATGNGCVTAQNLVQCPARKPPAQPHVHGFMPQREEASRFWTVRATKRIDAALKLRKRIGSIVHGSFFLRLPFILCQDWLSRLAR